jgi:hypothetical protein
MISTPRQSLPQCADSAGGVVPPAFSIPRQIGDWHHIGAVADVAVWDELNRVKDRQDEELDAMRVSGGMTLDEFLGQK